MKKVFSGQSTQTAVADCAYISKIEKLLILNGTNGKLFFPFQHSQISKAGNA